MISKTDPWSFFDKIYCISIDTRIDRRTEAKKQFSKCELLDRVEFIIVKKHPSNQEMGIFQSHIACLQKGLQAGAKHILIFEDDILIKNFQPQSLCKAEDFLQRTPDWNAFFLGAISSKISKTDTPVVVNIQFRCLAHAYALNKPFAKHIIQQPWIGIPFDDMLREQSKISFAISPMIAFQNTTTTDNQTVILDRVRRFFGGLLFIQKSNEFFQYHKTLIVYSHIAFFTLLVLIGVCW